MASNTNRLLKDILFAVQTSPTLTTVADSLYTTQPNVSKTITDAERKYGVTLVNRNKTPISLTAAGESLLVRLNQILNLEEQTLEEMQSYQNDNRQQITIAFFPTYAPIIFPKLYFHLKQKYPNLRFKTLSLTNDKALAKLKDGQVNILIGRNANSQQIKSWPLFTEKLCFVISKESPLYSSSSFKRKISNSELKNLQNENHISCLSETSFIDITKHFFTLNDLHFKNDVMATTYEEALFYASKGMGITMTMEKTAEFFLENNKDVNLLIIPEKMVSLEISTMIVNNDPFIEEIAENIINIYSN